MPRPNPIVDLANEQGITPELLVQREVAAADNRIFRAAMNLRVAPEAVRYWLRKAGVSLKIERTVVPIDHAAGDNGTTPTEPAVEAL